MGRAVEFAGVHVIFADPEADAGGLETGLRQVSRRAVTGRQERHFQRRDFVADALLHRLDAADRAANGVLRLVGIGVENDDRSEEHTSELQTLMRISYAVFCLQTKKTNLILKT